MNLSLPLNLEMPSSEPELAIDWETWGEDSVIELCEVRLEFDASPSMGEHRSLVVRQHYSIMPVMSAMPLPPLHGPGLGLTNLTFVSTPPSPPGVTEIPPGVMYLAASYLDFGDCKQACLG
jgi:hypothetical protein